MTISDLIKKLTSVDKSHEITWRVDPYEGVDFIFPQSALSDPELCAIESPFFGLQYAYIKGLHEQGYATKNLNGFTVLSEQLVELDDDFFQVFELPGRFPGKYMARFEGSTGQAAFTVNIDLIFADSPPATKYVMYGPFLKLGADELYRVNPAEWQAFTALNKHAELEPSARSEYENNWMVFQLQIAKQGGMNIGLAHFDNLELAHPESVGVSVEQLANGDLALSPTYGAGIAVADIKSRLGQIAGGEDRCILRVKNKFVLLDEDRLKATEEILSKSRIPKEQVSQFLRSPTAYLDASLIDLDTGFSLRVLGAERFTHKYFGDIEESGIDWFSVADVVCEPIANITRLVNSEEELQEFQEKIENAQLHGAETIELEGRSFDVADSVKVVEALSACRERINNQSGKTQFIDDVDQESDSNQTDRAVLAITDNDEEEKFTKATRLDSFNPAGETFDIANLKRAPYPHQEAGIRWLLAHLESATLAGGDGGALLADDMGLGKTFMALVAVQEWYYRCKNSERTEKPTLIVAPLSLLENWKAEVFETFHKPPFEDIVVLQAGADLPKFRVSGAGRETQQQFDEGKLISMQDKIRYSLKVGRSFGNQRLDVPRRLVLVTYQTLRDYQFSLSRIDWGVVVFDEAQNLKNPNALATRAAKGLKSEFKLLATGTPVENSLKDFWCLLDTAIPGLLGAWQSFRRSYIAPITSAAAEDVKRVKVESGSILRAAVGEFMLRRTKASHLTGLPQKRIYSGDQTDSAYEYMASLAGVMKGPQLVHYDDIIGSVRSAAVGDRSQLVLPSLLRLKITSIHQDIEAKHALPTSGKEMLKQAEQSIKLAALINILRDIEKRGEKAIIFATTKSVQAYVCALVTSIFSVPVAIINGDTKAVPSKLDSQTRKVIIDKFQDGAGFGVIIMSPVAAGVGLTIVEANNVIHLERHWNPAKEAQATDRVYRIGQKRDVNVYLPMALHPSTKSFDLKLNGLLVNKIDLSDAVVAPSIVDSQDLESCF